MKGAIRVLLIGAGKMGRNHLRLLRANPRFEVLGIVDPDPAVQAICEGREHWWPRYPHLGGAFDAVVVASPSVYHIRARGFAFHRIPTLVEKPLALSSNEAGDFLTSTVSPFIVVGHVERFNPAARALRKALESLGEIRSVEAYRSGGAAIPADAILPNIVFDLAVHDIDICRRLFGPLRLEDNAVFEHGAYLWLRSSAGARLSIVVGRGQGPKRRCMSVIGSRGIARVDYIEQTLAVDGAAIPVEKDEPLRAELNAFATFVETGERGDLCSAEDGAAAVLLCEQALTPRGYV